MSYRSLRAGDPENSGSAAWLHASACRYANYLWLQDQPARAILALCRALYIKPRLLEPDTRQPYDAFAWILQSARGPGFLGNPRISFVRQATRIHESNRLKRQRAWALWYLSCEYRPELPPDPRMQEDPPAAGQLIEFLNKNGLPFEGDCFSTVLNPEQAG